MSEKPVKSCYFKLSEKWYANKMNPFLALALLFSSSRAVYGMEPLDVYWNISNPIFSGGYGDGYENVIEVNRDTHPWEYDQVLT